MLCLFDLDGTLIDSEPGITACIRHAFDKLGVPAPVDLRPWIGPPLPFGSAFEKLYGPDPDSAHCEKATMIADALTDFGTAPEAAAMIGDRRYDIEGAVANRVRGIGVLWGFGSREELQQAGAQALASDPAHLVDLLAA